MKRLVCYQELSICFVECGMEKMDLGIKWNLEIRRCGICGQSKGMLSHIIVHRHNNPNPLHILFVKD